MKVKIIGIACAVVLVAALVAVASGATSAFFSDTKSGGITGTLATIDVTTSGGTGADGLTFVWNNMLPGEQYSATAHYQNTGEGVQDVWLVFPNATALSALNDLGRYGEVWVDDSNSGRVFFSCNLNDHPDDQGHPADTGHIVRMLPPKIKLASNLGPTASGSMTFTFQYASALTTQSPGAVFNFYPVPGQTTINPGDGTGNGLPFDIVATQPGIAPGTVGDYVPLP